MRSAMSALATIQQQANALFRDTTSVVANDANVEVYDNHLILTGEITKTRSRFHMWVVLSTTDDVLSIVKTYGDTIVKTYSTTG